MRELFELGYQRAIAGPEWLELPPGFGSVDQWRLQSPEPPLKE
jgi:hypothetical protein